jgi:hypothetical protein
MTLQYFEAQLKRPSGIGAWTYLDIPFSIPDTYGVEAQLRVKGSINGHPFRSSARPHGDGRHYIVVSQSIRDAIGVTRGDFVRVSLERDDEPREVNLPFDLALELQNDPVAFATYNALSYSHQRAYIEWIEEAKKPETRQKRITQAIDRLQNGQWSFR